MFEVRVAIWRERKRERERERERERRILTNISFVVGLFCLGKDVLPMD